MSTIATTIINKTGSGKPSNLENGEIAWDRDSNVLYIGDEGSVVPAMQAHFDSRYLKLDCSNAPLTGDLTVNGKVGIGTTSPGSLLHLQEDTDDVLLQLGNTGLTTQTSGHGPAMRIYGSQGASTEYGEFYINEWSNFVADGTVENFRFAINPKTADDVVFTFGNHDDYGIGYSTSDDTLQFVNGNVIDTEVRMVLDNNGNVGIGTDSPDAQLHTTKGRVVGTSRYTANQTLDADDHHVFCNTDGGAFTVTLPASPTAGQEYRIINTGSSGNNLTIDNNGNSLLGNTSTHDLGDGESLIIVFESIEGWF